MESRKKTAGLPETGISDNSIRALVAIMETTRLQILLLLGKQGSMNVGEIAARFSISQPAISHHLKILRDAGIVLNTRKGQEIHYRVDTTRVAGLLRSVADTLLRCCPTEAASQRGKA